MKNCLVFLIVAFATTLQAQTIHFSEIKKLQTERPIKIYQSIKLGDNILAVGLVRKPKGDVDAIALLVDSTGHILQENIIGEALKDERATNVLSVSDGTCWVLVNSVKYPQTTVELHQLDSDFNTLQMVSLQQNKLLSATGLLQTGEQELTITAMYEESPQRIYPVLISCDIATQQQRMLAIDHDSPSMERKQGDVFLLDSEGKPVEMSPEALTQLKSNTIWGEKEFNKHLQKASLSEGVLYLVGSENTPNIGDCWAAKVTASGRIVWEEVYEKADDVGADMLMKALPNGEQTALFGEHYKKKDQLNYNYNYLLVDAQGKELINQIYDTGYDEHLIDAIEKNGIYWLCGYVDIEPDKSVEGENYFQVGARIIDRDILVIGIDPSGKKVAEQRFRQPGFQKLVTVVDMEDHVLLVGTTNADKIGKEKPFFLRMDVE